MKKALALLLCLLLACGCCLPALAAGDGGQSGMTLSTVVPDTHTVQVDYNQGGYVMVNGALCEDGCTLTVPRHSQLALSLITRKGYVIESVVINGADVTGDVVNGTYMIPSVSRDTTIVVTFRARTAAEEVLAVDVAGKVYRGEDLLPDAELNLDFGSSKVVSGQDGGYLLEDIEDGRHYLEIVVDGKVIGRAQFVLEAADVSETVVDTLSDGTQRVRYPKGAEKVYLDFIVNADGSITIRPGEAPITPPVTPQDKQPEIPNLGDSLMVLFLLLLVAAAAMMALASRRRREYTF